MATRKATITVDTSLAAVYNAAPKTRQKQAQLAMRRALQAALVPSPTESHLSKKETALFLRINRYLTPEQQGRYDELHAKREDETLTLAEHAALLQLVEEVETIWVDRVQALLELARLRRLSPQQLMQQLAIDPHSYAS